METVSEAIRSDLRDVVDGKKTYDVVRTIVKLSNQGLGREARKPIYLNRMRKRKKSSLRPISMAAEADQGKKIDEKNDGECLKLRMRTPKLRQPHKNLTSNTQMTKSKLVLNR
jgi:hypothetical protein